MKKSKKRQALDIFQFKWVVRKGKGYGFFDGIAKLPHEKGYEKARYLCVAPGNTRRRTYEPLVTEPLLFTKFAELDGSEDSIVNFANEYGRLGIESTTGARGIPQFGELLKTWQREIYTMACAVMIFGYLKDSESKRAEKRKQAALKTLGKHIVWSGDGSRVSFDLRHSTIINTRPGLGIKAIPIDAPIKGEIASVRRSSEIFQSFEPGEVTQPARLWLSRLINSNIYGETSPCLIFDENMQLVPYVSPDNLRACLWLQLYSAFSDKQFVRCAICKGWMDTTGQRSDKKRHDECYDREKKRRRAAKAKARKTGQTK